MTDNWLNINAYANHRGVDQAAVRYAIKHGKIRPDSVKQDGSGRTRVNARTADLEWDPKVDARVKNPPVPETDGPSHGGPSYQESKAKREAAEAALAELKLEKERGRLLDAEEVRKSAFNAARMVRNLMMNIPDRVAAELAAETDVFKVGQRLKDEIRKALEGLGKEEDGLG